MSQDIPVAKSLPIREAGFDEYWLQDQIFDNPACLGLGDLEAIAKERQQSSGGRLDILLKNPEDDTMYEVEVMLGETDETHIVRTIDGIQLFMAPQAQSEQVTARVSDVAGSAR